MKPGTRVRVRIQRPSEYATGCAAALSGLHGTVTETGQPHSEGHVLVTFDRPAPTWYSTQLPCIWFWFPSSDLELEESGR